MLVKESNEYEPVVLLDYTRVPGLSCTILFSRSFEVERKRGRSSNMIGRSGGGRARALRVSAVSVGGKVLAPRALVEAAEVQRVGGAYAQVLDEGGVLPRAHALRMGAVRMGAVGMCACVPRAHVSMCAPVP